MPNPYATTTDLANAFNAAALAPIAIGIQSAALQGASDYMDSYLNSQYKLPIINNDTSLTRVCCEIAVYDLLIQRGFNPKAGADIGISSRYENAIEWLRMIAKGEVHPRLTDSSSPMPPQGAEGTGFTYSAGAPVNNGSGSSSGSDFWNNGHSPAANGAVRGW